MIKGNASLARILTLIVTTCLTLLLSGQQSPNIGDLQVLPEDNPWNWDISGYEVHTNSGNYIKSIGEDGHLHPDFGTEWMGVPNGIPYVVVDIGEPEIQIYYTDFGPESDPGPFPIPLDAPIEGGSESQGDRHVIAVDIDNKMLYELYYAFPKDSSWNAASGAKFDLTSNALRPAGWTSADAAGLPIFPGLVRYEEVYINNEIDHALRFTVANTQKAYIWPARHYASSNTNTNAPPMGLRLRLKDSVDISAFSDPVKVILTALKKYGMMVADNGSDWFISGAPDERWNDDLLGEIKAIPGKHFEVVRTVDDNGDPIYPTTQSTVEKITNGNFSSTAYPNPFRDKTTITYILQQNSFVELSIMDIQGRKVETLIKNKLAKGEHHVTFNRQNYASGLYFYILIIRNKRETGKLVVVN